MESTGRPFQEAFIRPGRDERNWIHRTTSTAIGVVATAADEISLFTSRNYTYPSTYLERFTLRTDGFVSIKAPYSGGEFLTRPLRFKGTDLVSTIRPRRSAASASKCKTSMASRSPASAWKSHRFFSGTESSTPSSGHAPATFRPIL